MSVMTRQLSILLYEPEIPGNTGNLIRLSANIGASLHLIEPLGFDLSDRQVKRAGLDYHDLTHVHRHANLDEALNQLKPDQLLPCSTSGQTRYDTVPLCEGHVALLFGPETRGLPKPWLAAFEGDVLTIPMQKGARSLNLANSVSVIAYDIWRRWDFSTLYCT